MPNLIPANAAVPGTVSATPPAARPASFAGPAAPRPSPALDWLAAPPTHPHEMKAAYDVRLGPLHLSGGARMTPTAVVAAGICTGLILMGVAAVVRAGRR